MADITASSSLAVDPAYYCVVENVLRARIVPTLCEWHISLLVLSVEQKCALLFMGKCPFARKCVPVSFARKCVLVVMALC